MQTNLAGAGQRFRIGRVASMVILLATLSVPVVAQVELQPAIDPSATTTVDAELGAAADVETDAAIPPTIIPTPPNVPSIQTELPDTPPEVPPATLDPRVEADSEIGVRERIAPTAIDTTFRGRLAVAVQPLDGRLIVRNVTAGGAGASVGLQSGDEIISVNGRRVSTGAQLITALRLAGDDTGWASVVINRDGAIETLDADVTGRIAPTAGRVQTYYRATGVAAPATISVAAHGHYPMYYSYYGWPAWPYYYPYYTSYYPYSYPYYPYGYWYAGYYPGWGYPYCR